MFAIYQNDLFNGKSIRIYIEKENGEYQWFENKINCEKQLTLPILCANFGSEVISHILWNIDKETLEFILKQRNKEFSDENKD